MIIIYTNYYLHLPHNILNRNIYTISYISSYFYTLRHFSLLGHFSLTTLCFLTTLVTFSRFYSRDPKTNPQGNFVNISLLTFFPVSLDGNERETIRLLPTTRFIFSLSPLKNPPKHPQTFLILCHCNSGYSYTSDNKILSRDYTFNTSNSLFFLSTTQRNSHSSVFIFRNAVVVEGDYPAMKCSDLVTIG